MWEGSGRTSSFFHYATPQHQLSPFPLAPGMKDMRLTHAAPQASPFCSFLLGLPAATICEPQTNSKKFLRNPWAPQRGSYSHRLWVCLCFSSLAPSTPPSISPHCLSAIFFWFAALPSTEFAAACDYPVWSLSHWQHDEQRRCSVHIQFKPSRRPVQHLTCQLTESILHTG